MVKKKTHKQKLSKRERQLWWSDRSSNKHVLKRRKTPSNILNQQNPKVKTERIILKSPRYLDIETHSSQSLEFFKKVRESDLDIPIKIDLTPLMSITPACVVILAAEMERRCLLTSRRFVVTDYKKWNETVRNQLQQVGFFEILKMVTPENNHDSGTVKFIKMSSSNIFEISNDNIEALKIDILDLIKHIKWTETNKARLYSALSEPINNTLEHAYPNGSEYNPLIRHKWWAAASYNSEKNILNMIVYDVGITIPEAIRSHYVVKNDKVVSITKRKRKLFLDKMSILSDCSVIDSTMQGKSGSKLENRGYGLPRMRKFLETNFSKGVFRVTSRKGQCIYRIGKDIDASKEVTHNKLDLLLNGTLIEWEIEL